MFEGAISYLIILEALGTVFGVAQVLLSRNNNINNYLFGIAGILIAIWVYYHSKLYADILLNFYYLAMSIYGWFYWKFGGKHKEAPITHTDKKDLMKASGIALLCFGLMAYWLNSHTDSDVPIWDALVAAFAWGGMWLLAKRKIENWVFLGMSNLIAIPLLIYKSLFIYAGLTVFLLIMSVSGFLKWKTIYKNEKRRKNHTTP